LVINYRRLTHNPNDILPERLARVLADNWANGAIEQIELLLGMAAQQRAEWFGLIAVRFNHDSKRPGSERG
jgi:hypothetical protein